MRIQHVHDIPGGVFVSLLMMFRPVALLALAGLGYLGFLAVQDWSSGYTMKPAQYAITLSPADTGWSAIETGRATIAARIINRSQTDLTRADFRTRIYTCPSATSILSDCNKVEDRSTIQNVSLAPGEATSVTLGRSYLFVPGALMTDDIRVQTTPLAVYGDRDHSD